jgi:hypothetical protein
MRCAHFAPSPVPQVDLNLGIKTFLNGTREVIIKRAAPMRAATSTDAATTTTTQ